MIMVVRLLMMLLVAAIAVAAHSQPQPPNTAADLAISGFTLDLALSEGITACTGEQSAYITWRQQIMAARETVVVTGDLLLPAWTSPLVQLRKQRPEVVVIVITEQGDLQHLAHVESLFTAGVKVFIHAPTLAGAGIPAVPAIRGLCLIRDDKSSLNGAVMLVSGPTADPVSAPSLAQAWLMQSPPFAKSYGEFWRRVSRQLTTWEQFAAATGARQ